MIRKMSKAEEEMIKSEERAVESEDKVWAAFHTDLINLITTHAAKIEFL